MTTKSTKPRATPKKLMAQLKLLHDGGAMATSSGKGVGDIPGLDPAQLSSCVRRKLVKTVEYRSGGTKRPIWWLTPNGVLLLQSEAPATTGRAAKTKAPKHRAGDLIAPRVIDAPQDNAAEFKITKPGFYRMSSVRYHGDPCAEPALSSSIAYELVDRSPAHAWLKSPRCPLPAAAKQPDPTYGMDIGSAVHAFTFGDPKADVVWIDAADFKENRTRGWRAAARAEGKTPILKKDKERVLRMADLLKPVLEKELGCKIKEAYGEIVIAALIDGAWARTRCDLLRADALLILDVKTTGLSAHPDAAGARLFDGAHIQEGLTHHILDALNPENAGRRTMKFVAIEQDEPHGISINQIEAESAAIAAQQTGYALDAWAKGIATKKWPDYDRATHNAKMKPWEAMAWRAKAIELGLESAS